MLGAEGLWVCRNPICRHLAGRRDVEVPTDEVRILASVFERAADAEDNLNGPARVDRSKANGIRGPVRQACREGLAYGGEVFGMKPARPFTLRQPAGRVRAQAEHRPALGAQRQHACGKVKIPATRGHGGAYHRLVTNPWETRIEPRDVTNVGNPTFSNP